MSQITVDIQAKVVGYQASLKQMQQEIAKLDPGSEIGKKLGKAFEQASAQLKGLEKNMSPKASSMGQIEAVTERVNKLGDTIQSIAAKMQEVTVADFKADSFGAGVNKITADLQNLKTQLDNGVTDGIRNIIDQSQQLKDAFSNLKIDYKKQDYTTMLDGMAKGVEDAAKRVADAQKELDKATKSHKKSQAGLDALKANPLSDKNKIESDLKGITDQYTKGLETLKEQVSKNVEDLFKKNNITADPKYIISNFLGGLTPQNLTEHIQTLKNDIQNAFKASGSTINAKDLYGQIFGQDMVTGLGRSTEVGKNLINTLFPNFEQTKTELKIKFAELSTALKPTEKQSEQIGALINEGNLEAAVQNTMQLVEKAYKRVQEKIDQETQVVAQKLAQVNSADTKARAEETNYNNLVQAQAEITSRVDALQTGQDRDRARITALEQAAGIAKQQEVEKTRFNAANIGQSAQQFRMSSAEAIHYSNALDQVTAKEQMVGKIQGVVQRWFSIYTAVRMVGNAIRDVISTISELDKTITSIAIVTDMSQNDLWAQMPQYTQMAREYASSISGVYKVSQLYYQQGLQTGDVMALTEQTLKMARISGLEYATATDYMTNAIRSFKMEMTDAQTVVDTYAAVAASSATSVSELANAMSKTASSAQAVGSSFQNTTAMMAVMIEATRESAENIGSALKSIISRYGEMKADPSKLVDSEGEEMDFNKVETALKTVGISLKDTEGQFREFDDVIMELAQAWDTIDTNTQRYIATVMAGNRQQSRFLALVSSGERLSELTDVANNSEDASQLQYLKSLDSVENKIQQLKTSMQELYVGSGLEKVYKWLLDAGNAIIKTFNSMPKTFNLPVLAIANFGTSFMNLALVVSNAFKLIKLHIQTSMAEYRVILKAAKGEVLTDEETEQMQRLANEQKFWQRKAQIVQQGSQQVNNAVQQGEQTRTEQEKLQQENRLALQTNAKAMQKKTAKGMAWSMAGLAISTLTSTSKNKDIRGIGQIGGSLAQAFGTLSMMPGPLGKVMAAFTLLSGVISGVSELIETQAEKIARLKEEAEEANNTFLQNKSEAKTLEDYIKKLEELEKKQNDSKEAKQEFLDLSNEIAEKYPELISSYTTEGDALVRSIDLYQKLKKAREEASESGEKAGKTAVQLGEEEYKKSLKDQAKSIGKYQSDHLSLSRAYENTTAYGQIIAEDSEVIEKYSNNLLQVVSSFSEAGNLLNDFIGSGNEVNLFASMEQFEKAYKLYQELDNQAKEALDKIFVYTDYSEDEPREIDFKEYIQGYVDLFGLNLTEQAAKLNTLQDTYTSALIQDIETSTSLKRIEKYNPNSSDYSFMFEELDETSSLIQSSILSEFEKYKAAFGKEKYNGEDIVLENGNTIYDQFKKDVYPSLYDSVYKNLKNFYNGLKLDGYVSDFNKLLTQRSKYTKTDFEQKIREYIASSGIDDLNIQQQIVDAILEPYKNLLNPETFKKGLSSRIERVENSDIQKRLKPLLTPEYLNYTDEELSAILSLYDIIDKQMGMNSEESIKILTGYMGVLDKVKSANLSETIKQQALTILSNWDDFTLNGFYNIINRLSDIGVDISGWDSTQNILDNIQVNLSTEYHSLVTSLQTQLKNLDDAFSKAVHGMTPEEASKMANKTGLDLSTDFRFDISTGKYFLDNIQAIKEVYFTYNQELLEKLNEKFLEQLHGYEGLKDIEDISELENFNWDSLEGDADAVKEIYNAWSQVNSYLTNYSTYQFRNALLQAGRIGDFIKDVLGENTNVDNVISNIMAGNYKDFEKYPEWIEALKKAVKDTPKSIFEKAIKSIKEGTQEITVDEFNKSFLEGLTGINNLELGKIVTLDFSKDAEQLYNYILQSLSKGTIDLEQATSLIQSLDAARYSKYSFSDVISEAISNQDKISNELWARFTELASQWGLENVEGLVTEPDANGKRKLNLEELYDRLAQIRPKEDLEEYNKILAQIDTAKREKSVQSQFENILKNKDSITEEMIASIATSVGTTYEIAKKYWFKENGNGTYQFDTRQIQNFINSGYVKINDSILQMITEAYDSAITAVTQLASNQNKGYTNLSEMQKFVTQLNQAFPDASMKLSTAFRWDDVVHAYVLTGEAIGRQIAASRNQLIGQIDGEREVFDNYIQETARQFAAAIKPMDLINSGTDSEMAQAEKAFEKAVKDYNDFIIGIGQTGDIVNTLDFEQIKMALKNGGQAAVDAAIHIAQLIGESLSTSDIESLYKSKINELNSVLELSVGSVISRDMANILRSINRTNYLENGIDSNRYRLKDIGDGQVVVEAVGDMVETYKYIYDEMAKRAEATTADLNSIKAKQFALQSGTSYIDALSQASSMTYDTLAEILTAANITLDEEFMDTFNHVLTDIGNGKVRITNFDEFAKIANLKVDYDSEEYISALKTYNDTLIELNNKVKKDIASEVEAISSAKPGDWLNLTQFYSTIIPKLMEKITSFDFEYNGNVKLDERPIVPIQKIIDKWGQEFAGGDYATIFGTTVTGLELGFTGFLENVGATFSTILSDGTVLDENQFNNYVQNVYNSAVKVFLDSLGAINIEDAIKAEDAKRENLLLDMYTGDSFDETTTVLDKHAQAIHEQQAAYYDLLYRLQASGASIEDGILKLSDDADILGVVEAIYDAAKASGEMLESDLAALADAIDEIIKGYAETISNGIQGKLSNSQKVELQKFANNTLGIDLKETDFTRTADGLKLSQNAAIGLYNRLKEIDAIAANIVFDSLRESLEEAGEACQNMSKTLASISQLQDKIAANKEAGKVDNSDLEQRLALYQEIAEAQMSNPESYDFMGQALPDYLQGPKNYWDSWGKAFKAMNEATANAKKAAEAAAKNVESGETAMSGATDDTGIYMEIQDFYNIVNEMNNLAKIGGDIEFLGMTLDGSLESARALIEKGLGAIKNINGEGAKIDLSTFGIDFEMGAADMAKNVDGGLKAFAESQIKMLDGMIGLLEVVVQMEGLSDITLDDGVTLDFEKMFEITTPGRTEVYDPVNDVMEMYDSYEKLYHFSKGMQDWAQKIINLANDGKHEDLAEALKSLSVNGESIGDILNKAAKDIGFGEQEANSYFTALQALYKMVLSGKYDEANWIRSIKQISESSGAGIIEFDYGETKIAVGYGFTVEYVDNGKDKKGYFYDGKYYGTAEEALQAMALKKMDVVPDSYTFNSETKVGTATVKIGGMEVHVRFEKGETIYTDPETGDDCTYQQIVDNMWERAQEENPDLNNKREWAKTVGIEAKYAANVVLTPEGKDQIAGKTAQQMDEIRDLVIKAVQGQDLGEIDLKEKLKTEFGIELNADITSLSEAELQQLYDLLGIKTNETTFIVGASFTGEGGEQLAAMLNGESIPVNADVDVEGVEVTAESATPSERMEQLINKFFTEGLTTDEKFELILTILEFTYSNGTIDPESGPELAEIRALVETARTQGLTTGDWTASIQNLIISLIGTPDISSVDAAVTATTNSWSSPVKELVGLISLILASNGTPSTSGLTNATSDAASEWQSGSASNPYQLIASILMKFGITGPSTSDLSSAADSAASGWNGYIIPGTQTAYVSGLSVSFDTETKTPTTSDLTKAAEDAKVDPVEKKDVIVEQLSLQLDQLIERGIISEADKQKILDALEKGEISGEVKALIDAINLELQKKGYSLLGADTIHPEPFDLGIRTGIVHIGQVEVQNDTSSGEGGNTVFPTGTDLPKPPPLPPTSNPSSPSLPILNPLPPSEGKVFPIPKKSPPKAPLNGDLNYTTDLDGKSLSFDELGELYDQYNQFTTDLYQETAEAEENFREASSIYENLFRNGQDQYLAQKSESDSRTYEEALAEAKAKQDKAYQDYLDLQAKLDEAQKQLDEIEKQMDEAGKEEEAAAYGASEASNQAADAAGETADNLNEAAEASNNIADNLNGIQPVVIGFNGTGGPLGQNPFSGTTDVTADVDVTASGEGSDIVLSDDTPVERSIVIDFITDSLSDIWEQWQNLFNSFSFSSPTIPTATLPQSQNNNGGTPQSTPSNTPTLDISSIFGNLSGTIETITGSLSGLTSSLGTLSTAAERIQAIADASGRINAIAGQRINSVATAMNAIPSDCYSKLNKLNAQLDKLNTREISVKIKLEVEAAAGAKGNADPSDFTILDVHAKGNVALAGGKKRTLMGELGPELVVSNGRYFVVGQGGAEFVDLDDDAIVFNHLQTRSLLSNGVTSRGKPITSEKTAVSFATGNATGPAKASAEAALSALRQIRAMWEAMLGATLHDLGQQAGQYAGGGAGGGGGGGGDKSKPAEAYIADLDRWYTLLRQISSLEKEITYQESLRSKLSSDLVTNGELYYESQKKTLKALDDQIAKSQDLAQLQRMFYDERREELNKNWIGQNIFKFDENGVMTYTDKGLALMAELNAQGPDNKPKYPTAKDQFDFLVDHGYYKPGQDIYDTSGKLIKWEEDGKPREEAYSEAVQAFWDAVDAQKEELDSLYDSLNDTLNDVLAQEQARNEILKEMQENQLNLEQKVVKAIENREQKVIDALQDEKDALEKMSSDYIDGLSEALEKERSIYDRQQSQQDLDKLRRQLGILQRSGGSTSQIRQLQTQIQQKEQDAYFEAQQEQIDAIQEASDKELERLDHQIEIMTESLEYQKEHGLLWAEVSQIMAQQPEEIYEFLTIWDPDFSGLSALGQESTMQEIKSMIYQWTARRDDEDEPVEEDRAGEGALGWKRFGEQVKDQYASVFEDEKKWAEVEKAYLEEYAKSADPNKAAAAARAILEEYNHTTDQTHPAFEHEEQQQSSTGSGGYPIWLPERYQDYWDKLSPKVQASIGNIQALMAKMKEDGYGRSGYRNSKDSNKLPLNNSLPNNSNGADKENLEDLTNSSAFKEWKDKIINEELVTIRGSIAELQALYEDAVNAQMGEHNYGDSIVIEHAEVNMNTTISDDYDARQAGQNALDEMIRIARKKSVTSLGR